MLGLRDGSSLAPQDFSLPDVEPTKICCTKTGRGYPSIHKRKEEIIFHAERPIILLLFKTQHQGNLAIGGGEGHAEHFGG